METLAYVVMAFVTVSTVVLGAYMVKARAKRREQERIAFCDAHGWSYSAGSGRRLFRIEGDIDGIPWEILCRRRGNANSSSSSSPELLFVLPAPPIEEVALIGLKLPALVTAIDLGGSLVQRILTSLLGEDAKYLADVEEVLVGSSAFQETFTVLASDPTLAQRMLTEAVERDLLDWMRRMPSHPLVVFRWRDRMEIRMAWGNLALLAEVVELATALQDSRSA